MNVLIICHEFVLDNSTGSLRVRAFHKYLSLHGIKSYVVTSKMNQEIQDVISVTHICDNQSIRPLYIAWRLLGRILSYLGVPTTSLYWWKKAVLSRDKEIFEKANPSLIVASYPSMENLEIGLALSSRFQIPLISDFRDGLMFEPLEAASMKRAGYRKYCAHVERMVVRQSSAILTVTNPISDYFRTLYSKGQVITLPNGYDFSDIVKVPTIKLGDKFNIVYTGRLSASRRGAELTFLKILRVLELLEQTRTKLAMSICFHFIGFLTHGERTLLKPFAKKGMVKVHGHQSRGYAVACQNSANALLLIVSSDHKSVATGKVFEYLAARKPILEFARGTVAARIAKDSGLGVSLDENYPDEVINSLESLISNRLRFSPNESYIKLYNRKQQVAELANIIKSTVDKKVTKEDSEESAGQACFEKTP